MIVTRIGSHDGDDAGVVAVIVALLVVILVGMVAFTVDFGAAYSNRVDLQNAADAAALAAAVELQERDATCPVSGADRAAAEATAADLAAQNMPTGVAPLGLEIECNAPGYVGTIKVTWTNEAPINTTFGAVWGVNTLEPYATASAVLAGGGGGLRPLALCLPELPVANDVGRVNFDGANSNGGCDGLSGNWRSTDCPESDNNGNPEYIVAVESGCSDPVVAVPGTPTGSQTLTEHLLAACPPGNGDSDQDCLGGNTGQVFGGQITDAWQTLQGTRFTLPVLCGPAMCDPAASQGSGNTAQYPVYRIAEVTLCGVHKKNHKESKDGLVFSTAPECAGASSEAGDAGDNWLVIRMHAILGPGDAPSADAGGGPARLVN